LRAFLKWIALEWGREQRSSRALAIAGIHATVLTILIGITLAYYIFARDKIHEMEMQGLREAEKINQVQFVQCYYRPNPDAFLKYSDPRNIEQAINLLPFLYGVLSEMKTMPGMEIPKMPADRAEKGLQIMSLLVHRYPFPESISLSSGSVSSFPPKPLLFKNRAEIAKWSADLEKLLGSMNLFIYMRPVFLGEKMNEYFQALYSRDKELRKKWKTDYFLQAMGYIDPYFLFNDYISNLQKADGINRSVKFYLDKIDSLERRLAPKKETWMVIGFILLAFFCGVILPLFRVRVRQIFLLWIPCCSYVIAFSFLVYRLLL
jgi:hypothetical protein